MKHAQWWALVAVVATLFAFGCGTDNKRTTEPVRSEPSQAAQEEELFLDGMYPYGHP
jgi:hypothetical protein